MAYLSLTWAWALLFTITLLSVSCETIPDPWRYRVQINPYFPKPFLFFMDDEHWYRSLLKSISDKSEEVNLIYVMPNSFAAKLTLEQVTKLKELPEISYIIPDHIFHLH